MGISRVLEEKKQTVQKPEEEKGWVGWVAVCKKHSEKNEQTSMKERLSSIKAIVREYVVKTAKPNAQHAGH